MLLLLSGTNKPGSYQPPFIDKSTNDETSFDEPTSDETCSHLQEATAQVPRHSIRANWSQHCNPVGGDSPWQSFHKSNVSLRSTFSCQAGDPTELRHDGRHTHWKLARCRVLCFEELLE